MQITELLQLSPVPINTNLIRVVYFDAVCVRKEKQPRGTIWGALHSSEKVIKDVQRHIRKASRMNILM